MGAEKAVIAVAGTGLVVAASHTNFFAAGPEVLRRGRHASGRRRVRAIGP